MPKSISTIAKALMPIAKVLLPKLRHVYRERQAGRMPVGGTDDLLEKGMEGTLKRLVGGKIDDAWWRRTLDKFGHKYIAPDLLRIHAIREWLSVLQVQADFKSLVRKRIMGANDEDQNVWKRLRHTYAEFTGEDERLADWPVQVIVAIIATGYVASTIPEIEPVMGMIQDHDRESKKYFKEIDDRLTSMGSRFEDFSPNHYAVEANTNLAQKEINQLLKRRSLELDRTLQEIITLTKRIVGGDLSHADDSIKAKVFYWSARLHASKTETLPVTRENLEQLLKLVPKTDIRIIDALILETGGDADGALRILRDIESPDGRSTFLIVNKRKKGVESALLWFDEQPERDKPEFFTGIGWANLAITLAQKGRCRFSNYLDRNFLIKLNNKDCFQIRLNWADR